MTMSGNAGDWAGAALAGWSLAIESAIVVALRSRRIAAGGAVARREATLMVQEKIVTAIEVQAALVGGRLGHDPGTIATSIVAVYARKVRANRARLGG